MKIYKIIGLLILGLLITGCSNMQPQAKEKIEYITQLEVKEVQVPIIYEIPNIDCEFSGDYLTPSVKLVECLKDHKELIESIKRHNEELKSKYKETLEKYRTTN